MKKITALWTSTLYYAQGLPFSIVRQMAVVFFTSRGASLQSLGMTAFYGLPWTFKFLWSPFVDTYGTIRRWVLIMEMILILGIAVLCGAIYHEGGLKLIAFVFLAIGFISATHDIAVDGFYLENLDKNEQAQYSGWIVAAYRLAILTGSGLLVALAGKTSWTVAFAVSGGIFVMLLLWHSFILPSAIITKEKDQRKLLDGFKSFLRMPGMGQAIAFIFLFKLGDALLFGMSAPFLLREAGLTVTQYGTLSGTFGVMASILASISGGHLVSKYGLRRMLWIFGFIQNLAIPVFAFLAYYKPSVPWLAAGIVIEQLAAGWGGSAYTNFVMRQVHPQFKATHYAIATGFMSFTVMVGGAVSGFLATRFGFTSFFIFAFVASIPGMLMIPMIVRRPECQLNR